MSDSDEQNNESLPLGDLEQIDKVCTQFEESWKAGNPERIEELLEGFTGQVRDKLLLEILLLEFEYRSQSETDVPIEEYRQRFPDDLDIVDQAIEQSSHDQTILTPGQSVDGQIPERIRYLGDYEILEEIARGGMGIVFKARQSTLGRIVAVKIMQSGLLSSEEQIARFEREAKLAGRLQHPNIVAVHEVGRHEGMPYFSMDFVDGHSLSEMVRENPLPPRDAARYVQVAAETVQKAHDEEGILHRDLKPSNILIDREDRVRITDFGLAKVLEEGEGLTVTDSIIGTPSYMPPEQAVGNKALIGVQSDVYSLGAVLYELLTGRPPFAAATAIETMHQVKTKEPVSPRVLNPDVPKDLETVCLKCLEKEPHKRYGTTQELANELHRFQEGRPVLARPVGAMSKTWRWVKRNPIVTALSAFSVLLLASGAGISTYYAITATDAQNQLGDKNTELANTIIDLRKTTQQLSKKSQDLTDELRISTSMRLAAQSQSVAQDLPVRSLLLGVAAVKKTLAHDGTLLPEAHQSLRDALDRVGGHPLVGHNEPVTSVAISPDGRWVVTAAMRDMAARLWDLTAENPAATPLVLGEESTTSFLPAGVHSVAFSPDSRWLVTGDDETARLWDLTANDPSASAIILHGHTSRVSSVAFSPDSRSLVTGSGNTVRLWDLSADTPGEPALVLWAHEGYVSSVAISPDGKWLVTCGGERNRTACLWDLTADDPAASVTVLRGHEDQVSGVEISPDSRWLVTASWDKTARLWDLTSDDPAASSLVLRGHEAEVSSSLSISPDGHWLVTCGTWDKTARLWDLTADDPTAVVHVLRGHEDSVNCAALTSDGRWLVTGSDDKTARLWDLNADDPAASATVLRGHEAEIWSIAVSPDGRWLVTGSRDETARLWNLRTDDSAELSPVLRGHEHWVTSVAISPDGRWLVTGSRDETARLWDLAADDPAASALVLRGHNDWVTSLTISPDARWLVTHGGATAQLWDLTADNPASTALALSSREDDVSSVAFSPDSGWLVTGTYNKTARLWDLTADDPTVTTVLRGHEDSVRFVAFSPDGRWLVTGSDKTARLWDFTTEDPTAMEIVLRGHEQRISSLMISPDSRWLVTGSFETARLWNLTVDDPASSAVVLQGHRSWVDSVVISPDGSWLVTGSNDWRLWDLTANDPAASTLVLPGQEGDGFVAFSPDERWLVTSSIDKTAQLWDLTANGHAVPSLVLRGHGADIHSLVISPESRWLVTSSHDGTARLWDLTANDPSAAAVVLRGHEEWVDSMAISPNSRWLVTGSGDMTARVWDLDIDSLVEKARRLAGRELTPEERNQYLLDKRKDEEPSSLGWQVPKKQDKLEHSMEPIQF